MTANEELRLLLDERGVEWWNETDPEPQNVTMARAGGQLIAYHENANGSIGYHVCNTHDLTPEQAIAATLGPAYEPPVAMHWNGDVLTLTIPRDPSCIRVQRSAEQPCKVYADESKVIAATLGNDGVGRTNDGLADLQAENAKLRELAHLFAEYTSADQCEGCVTKRVCNAGELDMCWIRKAILEKLRELGVEADG